MLVWERERGVILIGERKSHAGNYQDAESVIFRMVPSECSQFNSSRYLLRIGVLILCIDVHNTLFRIVSCHLQENRDLSKI